MVSSLTADGADATFEALRLGAVDFVAKPDGAISLHIDELRAELIAKVRAAAGARIRSSARLKDRVRHRIGARRHGDPASPAARGPCRMRRPAAAGEGLVLVGTSTGGPPALEALLTPLPGRLSLADRGRPAHAGDLHRARLPGGSTASVDAHRRRGRAHGPARAGLRLYRQGRCRHRGRPAAVRPRRLAGPVAKPIIRGIQVPTGSLSLPWITSRPPRSSASS